MDPEKILFELGRGKEVSQEELEQVVSSLCAEEETLSLREDLSPDDIYTFVTILGCSNKQEYRNILELCLDYDDPLTVAKVLETLCLDWQLVEDYFERVIHFVLGVSWDYEEDLRQSGIKILGEYLYKVCLSEYALKLKQAESINVDTRPVQGLDLLLGLFSNADNSSAEIRQSSYRALCRGYGLDWESIPSECINLDLSSDSEQIDRAMLSSLRAILKDANLKLSAISRERDELQ